MRDIPKSDIPEVHRQARHRSDDKFDVYDFEDARWRLEKNPKRLVRYTIYGPRGKVGTAPPILGMWDVDFEKGLHADR